MGRQQRGKLARRQARQEVGTHQPPALPATSRPLQHFLVVLFLLALAGSLPYLNILSAPFVFDDVSIRDYSYLQVKTVPELLHVLVNQTSDRRIGYFTFALNFYLGGLNTFGYHLTNLLIHIVNGWLVFWLVYRTLTLPRPPRDGPAHERLAWHIAFFSALVWLVHPVQIQAVTYIVQRLVSLAALLFLISFALYLSGRLRTDSRRYLLYGLSAGAGLLAMGVKQTAVVLPFLIFLYDLYFFHDSPWDALKKRGIMLALLGVFLLGATLVYLGPDFWATIQERYRWRNFTMGERLLTETRVVMHYLSLLVLPLPSRVNVDYDFSISTSLWTPPSTLPSLLMIIVLIGVAVAMAARRPLLSFAFLWFFINLALESTIIPLDLVFEHRLYLPSLGPLALGVGFILSKVSALMSPAPSPQSHVPIVAGPVLLSLLALALALGTYQRNTVWTDPVLLWQDNARKSPQKARVYGNLGKALLDAKRYDEAAVQFEHALKLNPGLLGAYTNLATIYIDHLQQYDKAEELLRATLTRHPNYANAHLNLGVIALNQRRLSDAIQSFTRVLELDPQNPMAHYNLAACYINLGDFPRAQEILDRGISYWPASHRLYLLKGRAYTMVNNRQEARKALDKAYALNPQDPEVQSYYKQLQ